MTTVAKELWDGTELSCREINMIAMSPATQIHRTDKNKQSHVDAMLVNFNTELRKLHSKPREVGFDLIVTPVDATQIAANGTVCPAFGTSVAIRACDTFARYSQ